MIPESLCNQKTFDFVFFSHAKDLRNYLYYKFGNLETAEDIVQESFIKLWINCAKVTFQKSKSYLFTIATNLFIDKKRHEKVVLQFKNKIQTNIEHESPDFILQEKEFMLKIQNTIGNLPDKQREVFLLSRIDKKTYKEIAELINISVKAVEKRMHNALITVRKEIGDI